MNHSDITSVRPLSTLPPVSSVALARLAFELEAPLADEGELRAQATRGLSFLGGEGLDLDLSDPAQSRLGEYVLLEKIGQGGMGVVFRARQESLDREVAIKLLVAGPWATPDFIERFRVEARSAARMQHPNIITIHEIDVQDGLPFFSMQLIRGDSLANLVRRDGMLEPRRAASLLRLVAEAVDYAHRLGVLHLDLKPGNILLDEHGEPRVADFGLARRLGNLPEETRDEISGTPSYMAPEQATAGGRLTERTDVYALGATLYELVTGCPPFRGATARETIQKVIAGGAAPPREFSRRLPLDLQAICLKCLSRDPDRRYASAREVADELARFLEGRPVQARPLNRVQRGWRWVRREPHLAAALLTVLIVLLVGLLATSLQWRRAEQSSQIAHDTAVRANRDLSRYGDQVGLWQANMLPILENLEALEARGDREGALIERRRIGIASRLGPRLIDIVGGDANIWGLAIDDAGRRVAASDAKDRLSLIDTARGAVVWQRPLSDDAGITIDYETAATIEFSPDGTRVIVYANWRRRSTGEACIFGASVFDSADGRVLHAAAPGTHCARFDRAGRALVDLGDHRAARVQRAEDFMPVATLHSPEMLGSERWQFNRQATLATRRLWNGSWIELLPLVGSPPARRFDLPDDARVDALVMLPGNAGIAYQDTTHAVSVLDPASGSIRRMQSPPRAGAMYLRASADGRYLSLASHDNALYVWDPASGALVARPPTHDMPPTRTFPDRPSRRVLTHWAYTGRVWDLPARGDEAGRAVSAGSMVHRGLINNGAAAWSARSAQVATAGLEGEVRLWRLARSPWLAAQAAPISDPDEPFDGEHVLGIDGTRLEVRALERGEATLSPWQFEHPVVAAAAAWSAGVVAAVEGGRVHLLDAHAGAPLMAAIELDGAVQGIALSADGTRLAVRHPAQDLAQEKVMTIGVRSTSAPAQLELPAPISGMRWSADGRRLLVWGEYSSIVLARAEGLTVERTWPAPAPGLWLDARISRDGRRLLAVSAENLSIGCWFWEWDIESGALLRRVALPGSIAAIAESLQGRVFLEQHHQSEPLEVVGNEARRVHRRRKVAVTGPLAVSPDGSLLATTTDSGIELIDLADGRGLLETPNLALALPETLSHLAFSANGDALLARTYFGRQLVLDLRPDTRPLAEIREELTQSTAATEPLSEPAGEVDRQRWRSRDPGVSSPPPWFDDDWVYPRRSAHRDAMLAQRIDLDAHANAPLAGPITASSMLGYAVAITELFRLPRGVQRFGAVDFELRDGIQLAADALALRNPRDGTIYPSRTSAIIVARRLDRLHLLLAAQPFGITDPGAEAARVEWTFADGSRSEQSIRFGTHLLAQSTQPSKPDDPRPVWTGRSAWNEARRVWVGYDSFTRVYKVSLDNPRPEQAVASLRMASSEEARSAPLLLALSAEGVDVVSNPGAAAPAMR